MDVDGLDTQAAALCTNAHELRPLYAADGGSHHHLVAVLDDVFDVVVNCNSAGWPHALFIGLPA
jgi:hypothetical protein